MGQSYRGGHTHTIMDWSSLIFLSLASCLLGEASAWKSSLSYGQGRLGRHLRYGGVKKQGFYSKPYRRYGYTVVSGGPGLGTRLWEGLPNRVMDLHAKPRQVINKNSFPSTKQDMVTMKGIQRNTLESDFKDTEIKTLDVINLRSSQDVPNIEPKIVPAFPSRQTVPQSKVDVGPIVSPPSLTKVLPSSVPSISSKLLSPSPPPSSPSLPPSLPQATPAVPGKQVTLQTDSEDLSPKFQAVPAVPR